MLVGMRSPAMVTVYAVLAYLLPAVVLVSMPGAETAHLVAAGAIAATMACALVALTGHRLVPVRVAAVGPPRSAQRRLRGAFLPQSNPDAAGRPRPRAPGDDHL